MISQNLQLLQIFSRRIKPDKAPPTEIISDPEKGCTHADIVASKHKLFFIKCTPDHKIQQRWYLVQVNLEATLEINKERTDIDS